MTISPSGRYTEHYYAGSERIMSRLMGRATATVGGNVGRNPEILLFLKLSTRVTSINPQSIMMNAIKITVFTILFCALGCSSRSKYVGTFSSMTFTEDCKYMTLQNEKLKLFFSSYKPINEKDTSHMCWE